MIDEAYPLDGMVYHAIRTTRSSSPVLFLHGFMGSGESWLPYVFALPFPRDAILVDLPGHGRTHAGTDLARISVERTADDLALLIERVGRGRPIPVIGYSLGARIALRLAVAHPERVSRLVLESPSAGVWPPAERAARRAQDVAFAMALEADGLEGFLPHWEAQPVFASQRRLPEALRDRVRQERLRNDPRGLAMSLRAAGQGAMEPLGGAIGSVAIRTLVLAGTLDTVGYDRARSIARTLLRATFEPVDGAGHRTHLEQPTIYQDLVSSFLQEQT